MKFNVKRAPGFPTVLNFCRLSVFGAVCCAWLTFSFAAVGCFRLSFLFLWPGNGFGKSSRGQKRRNEIDQRISARAVEVERLSSERRVRSSLARRHRKRVHQRREREENAIGAKFLSLWGAAGLWCLLSRLVLCLSVICSLWVICFCLLVWLVDRCSWRLGCLAGGLAGAFGCLVNGLLIKCCFEVLLAAGWVCFARFDSECQLLGFDTSWLFALIRHFSALFWVC